MKSRILLVFLCSLQTAVFIGYFWGYLGITAALALSAGALFITAFFRKYISPRIRNIQNHAKTQEALLSACVRSDLDALRTLAQEQNGIFLSQDFRTLENLIQGNLLQAYCSFSYRAKENPFDTCPPYYLGNTVAHNATKEQCAQVIQFLSTHGVGHARDRLFNQFPLCTAIGFDNNPVALALIDDLEKNNPVLLNDATTGRFPCTPLLLAVQKGNQEIFDALLRTKKININLPDTEHGLTPLHWAVIMCLPQMIERLIQEGADTQAISKTGKRPLDYLNITIEQVRNQRENGAQKLYSTQEEALKPVAVHFNNHIDIFLTNRNTKLEQYGERIRQQLASSAANISTAYKQQSSSASVLGLKAEKSFLEVSFPRLRA